MILGIHHAKHRYYTILTLEVLVSKQTKKEPTSGISIEWNGYKAAKKLKA